jgi:hypothetical protein
VPDDMLCCLDGLNRRAKNPLECPAPVISSLVFCPHGRYAAVTRRIECFWFFAPHYYCLIATPVPLSSLSAEGTRVKKTV